MCVYAAFGLGTMIYNGLECGAFFEVPFDSPCYQILRGVNPVLQMVFTFMQMYFIFMNSRVSMPHLTSPYRSESPYVSCRLPAMYPSSVTCTH
ncbi:hypothetical protein PR048_027037 [Dryococelus australis]|uniref:Uncharacterized protein n=1 Tax=Dryococelus australis TaxID=614101 RepID=A0ABQ9GEK1_9NEOP|nr:hypothetical protein PR048_027037 [Dryococelus australis]